MNAGLLTGWAYVLEAPGRLARQEISHDLDALAPTDIAMQTEFTAISPGTEVSAWRGDPPLRPGPAYPRKVGYCHVGRVVAVGADVATPMVEERVLTFTDHRSAAVLPAQDVAAVVEDAVPGPAAALVYLFHLGYAALLRANVTAGHVVAVVGLGTLGLATLMLAVQAGATVVAVSAREQALSAALDLGAALGVRAGDENAAEVVRRFSGLGGADIVIDTSNRWSDWWLALDLARKGGSIVVLGFPGRGEGAPPFNPLDSRHFYDKQLSIFAAGQSSGPTLDGERFSRSRNLAWLLGRVGSGQLDVTALAGVPQPARELESLYRALAERRNPMPTYVLDWS